MLKTIEAMDRINQEIEQILMGKMNTLKYHP